MERTSAACAMEWSIDLEKGLRSKKPGQSLEAIRRTGQRLEQWDREPAINLAQYNMFGLIPGEERLFAYAILLRLTDAFSSGDTQMKLCVVKIFLSLLRNRKRRSKQHGGVLFKCNLENRMELLRRVKIVFDTGDVESRALALVLFGCWSDIAKDSADIRYLILSSLVSCDLLQAEASLFASRCFCELSGEFATILLEILVILVTPSEMPSTVRLAGVRAFAKMGCSSLHASKAYEAGLKLMSDFSDEDLLVAMLISLSKLATKSARLVPGQVCLLFSFLTQGKPLRLQATALKCLHYIIVRGLSHFPANAVSIKVLISMLDESQFPPALQCVALQILHKVLLCNLPKEMLNFPELLTIIENATRSPIMGKRILAMLILLDLLAKLMGEKEKVLDGVDWNTLASRTVTVVMDQMSLLVQRVPKLHQLDSETKQEFHSLLGFLLILVENFPNLGGMVLDKICLLVETIVNVHDQVTGTAEPLLSVHEILELRGPFSKEMTSKSLRYVSRFVLGCLEKLNKAGAITTQVLETVELLVKHVQQYSLFDFLPCMIYCFLLRSHITYCCPLNETEKNESLDRILSVHLQDYLVQHEMRTLECAKNMLARKDNWSAYKVGKYAACMGAWFSAAFVFEHLVTMGQSDDCRLWLKSLARLAQSERIIQLLNLPEKGCSLVNWLEAKETAVIPFEDDLGERGQGTDWKLRLPNNIENLIEACNGLHSSEEAMGAIVTSGHALFFQRWFLALRAKVLKSVVDILRLYHVPFTQGNSKNEEQVDGKAVVNSQSFLQWATSLACSVTKISFHLNMLAREFDLLATSFRGMDKKSLEIISVHALSCSLLAFSTGFSVFFPILRTENILEVSDDCFGMLIQDLVWRMQLVDCETSRKLGLLWRFVRCPKSSFLHYRTQIQNINFEAQGLLTICTYAASRVVALQNETNRRDDCEILHQVTKDGLQLLLDITSKWMLIPFWIPKYFFRVRPCILSELFASKSDAKSPDGISVMPGFHMSLDLCLQLKNMPVDLPVQLTKLYCILHCKASFQVPHPGATEGQKQLGFEDSEADEMVYLNDKLMKYVMGSMQKATYMQHRRNAGDFGAEICVCFEPNEKGQGFSTCLLDVSTFPVGSYRIKWFSCCVDDKGSYWSLLPLNAGPVFTVQEKLPKY